MDKVLWLTAGNKGGVGKSTVAKSLVAWLSLKNVPLTIIEGDTNTPDVAAVFNRTLLTIEFDLQEEAGWAYLADTLCQNNIQGHTVANLPERLSERAVCFFERFSLLLQAHGYHTKMLFVMNCFPEGKRLFNRLVDSFPEVFPIKNLFFGEANQFLHFEALVGEYSERSMLFPAMNAQIMQIIRDSQLSFSEFITQRGEAQSNFIYAKIVAAQWYNRMIDEFDNALIGN